MKPNRSWPISLIAFFVVFIGAAIAFVIFASSHGMDLVAQDYYDRELRYEEQLEKIRHARSAGAGVSIQLQPDQDRLILQFRGPSDSGVLSGMIHVYRPSNAALDRAVPIQLDSEGVQAIETRALRAGLWRLKISWSTGGKNFYHEESIHVR